MNAVTFPQGRAFATVEGAAMTHNFRAVSDLARRHNPGARTVAVVKANAYGHGLAAALPPLREAGCDFFAVATLEEALEVRRLSPEADILILGYTSPASAPLLQEKRLTQTVFSAEYAAALCAVAAAARCHVTVHLKVDCGMCRLGLSPEGTDSLLSICRRPQLTVTGLFTHFPCADTDPPGTRAALERFLACRGRLLEAGYPLFCHAAASAAVLTLPEAILDGPRVGLCLYGIAPIKTNLALRPALSLCAPIVQIHEAERGTPVGYGGDFVTDRPARIGTLPIGYADGFCRRLTGLSVTVLHNGMAFSVPVVGRVSMDQLTVDLTDTPACVCDTVVLWQSAAPIAERLGTIPYEVLTAISPRVRRMMK